MIGDRIALGLGAQQVAREVVAGVLLAVGDDPLALLPVVDEVVRVGICCSSSRSPQVIAARESLQRLNVVTCRGSAPMSFKIVSVGRS